MTEHKIKIKLTDLLKSASAAYIQKHRDPKAFLISDIKIVTDEQGELVVDIKYVERP